MTDIWNKHSFLKYAIWGKITYIKNGELISEFILQKMACHKCVGKWRAWYGGCNSINRKRA